MNSEPATETEDVDPISRRRRLIFFIVWGTLFFIILWVFRGVLVPFCLAAVVAFVLAPLVETFQRVKVRGRPIARWASVVAVYAVLIGMLSLVSILFVPRIIQEVGKMASDVPNAVGVVRTNWIPAIEEKIVEVVGSYSLEVDESASVGPSRASGHISIVPNAYGGFDVQLPDNGVLIRPSGDSYRVQTPDSVERSSGEFSLSAWLRRLTDDTEGHAITLLKAIQSTGRAIIMTLFNSSIVLMLSAFLLISSESIFGFLRSFARRPRTFDRLLMRIDRGLSGVVRGQLLIALVNGILSGIGFWVLELPYWPLLTVLATVFSIIPIFGTIASSVPAVLLGLQGGITTALFVLGWITLIHQIEANFLNPKIMGDSAKLHPVLIIFALLAGEHVFGIVGALLGVPVLSILQSLFLHYREVALGIPAARLSEPPPPVAN